MGQQMNWLQEQQQEEDEECEEIYQQYNKYIEKLFPHRELQSYEKATLVSRVDIQRIANSLTCPLCQLFIKDPIYLSCSHRFCEECFFKYDPQLLKKNCPICNTFLQTQKIFFKDFSINQFAFYFYKLLLQFENKELLKRQENILAENAQRLKMFKSNQGEAIIIKKEFQEIKVKIQEQSDSQFQKGTCEKKKEVIQKEFQITKARSIFVLIPRQIKIQHLKTQSFAQIKAGSKFIKVRIQKLPSDFISPNLNIQQIMINKNCSTETLMSLIAQQFNISRQHVHIFTKIRSNFIQLNAKDLIKSKIKGINYRQHQSFKKIQGIKLSMNRLVNKELTYQQKFKSLKQAITLYFSVRFSQMIAQ